MIGIYKIENLINHKIYIGQSINIKERWNEHCRVNNSNDKIKQQYPLYLAFKKYGLKNFSFEVIEECSKEELDEKEKYWIKYYHSYYDDNNSGYNLTYGGNGNLQITEEEIKKIINLWEDGLSVGEISKTIKKDNHSIIRYLSSFCSSYNVIEGDKRGRTLSGIKHRKKLIQYDILGRIVNNYNSLKEAIEITKFSSNSITNNISHHSAFSHNYLFIYEKDKDKFEIILKQHYNMNKLNTPVLQLDNNNNVINCYLGQSYINIIIPDANPSMISACCCKKVKQAYGYFWKNLIYEDIFKYNLRNLNTKIIGYDVDENSCQNNAK